MFWKRRICQKCKTGKYTYELDRRSDACPYIIFYKGKTCKFFEPLKEEKRLFSGKASSKNTIPKNKLF